MGHFIRGRAGDAVRPSGVEPADSGEAQNRDSRLHSRKLKGLSMLTAFEGRPAIWSGRQIYDPQAAEPIWEVSSYFPRMRPPA